MHMVCLHGPRFPKERASYLGCEARFRQVRVHIVSGTGPRAPGPAGKLEGPACQLTDARVQEQAAVDFLKRVR